MEENKVGYTTIDEYIARYPADIQDKLQAMRKVIREAAPEAKEKISWGMATFDYFGNLVHFAANKAHIGFYPGASGVEVFKDRITEYKSSKGAIQFPYNKPMPFDLISEIVGFRIDENRRIAQEKRKKKEK